jgi:hypothetical protein
MLRKGIVLAALLVLPTIAQAQFEQGDKELTLGANAANGNDFDGFTGGGNASLGYFVTDNLELSVRQSLSYTDIGVDASLNGSTRVAADFHFDLGGFQPFIGANFGYVYGDAVSDTFEAAPEAGVKVFLSSTTFIYAIAEYQFFFDDADGADDAFEDGQFVYSLGIGFRF